MNKTQVTDAILKAKKNKGLSWAAIASEVGMSELWVASCAYGENSMTPVSADKLCSLLDLTGEVRDSLLEFPLKGNSLDGKLVPTDPLLYRFYEILVVYGKALKDSIQEKCGDGIMSAVDFSIDVQKVENPKGDRIVITMDGKFLAYKRF